MPDFRLLGNGLFAACFGLALSCFRSPLSEVPSREAHPKNYSHFLVKSGNGAGVWLFRCGPNQRH